MFFERTKKIWSCCKWRKILQGIHHRDPLNMIQGKIVTSWFVNVLMWPWVCVQRNLRMIENVHSWFNFQRVNSCQWSKMFSVESKRFSLSHVSFSQLYVCSVGSSKPMGRHAALIYWHNLLSHRCHMGPIGLSTWISYQLIIKCIFKDTITIRLG